MMRANRTGPLIAALFLFIAHSATAAPPASALLGNWAQNPACNGDGLTVLFSQSSMEVSQDGERRTLVSVNIRSVRAREVEVDTTAVDYVREPNSNPPTPGDVLRFRIEGNVLRLVGLTMKGKPVEQSTGGTVFHRCPK